MSPLIGTAAWVKNKKRYEVRSLLAFEYGEKQLLKRVPNAQFVKAELILHPIFMEDNEKDRDEIKADKKLSTGISIRRITEPWDDTLACWADQPETSFGDEIVTVVGWKDWTRYKDRPLKIDVTSQVKNMFQFGNYGFYITYTDSMPGRMKATHWIASAKYPDHYFRPELVITYKEKAYRSYEDFANRQGQTQNNTSQYTPPQSSNNAPPPPPQTPTHPDHGPRPVHQPKPGN